jgi:hypothetical protein
MLSATAPRRLLTAAQRLRILQLRRSGARYDEISREAGCSRGSAYNVVARELKRLAQEARAEADILRQQELDRLDALQAAVWAKALAGDLRAVDAALKVIDRRVKLFGLDAPTRTQVTLDAMPEAELLEEARRLGLIADTGPLSPSDPADN